MNDYYSLYTLICLLPELYNQIILSKEQMSDVYEENIRLLVYIYIYNLFVCLFVFLLHHPLLLIIIIIIIFV